MSRLWHVECVYAERNEVMTMEGGWISYSTRPPIPLPTQRIGHFKTRKAAESFIKQKELRGLTHLIACECNCLKPATATLEDGPQPAAFAVKVE